MLNNLMFEWIYFTTNNIAVVCKDGNLNTNSCTSDLHRGQEEDKICKCKEVNLMEPTSPESFG
jgi:hypothetical protein